MVDNGETSRAWKSVRISAKESLGYNDLKLHEVWFDEECSAFTDERKQANVYNSSTNRCTQVYWN
jgi:hypothetical protein